MAEMEKASLEGEGSCAEAVKAAVEEAKAAAAAKGDSPENESPEAEEKPAAEEPLEEKEEAAEAKAGAESDKGAGNEAGGAKEPGVGADEAPEEKEGFFGRRAKKELAKKDEELKAEKDRGLRLMAEFDNFRKRSEKEKSGMYAAGAKDVIEKILPVVDSFERGLSQVKEEDKDDPFTQGMEKIYKQLSAALKELGVTPIEAVGKPFDPNLHNAVMHEEDDSLGENVVAKELMKGYMYKDTVVRHSMVSVAN